MYTKSKSISTAINYRTCDVLNQSTIFCRVKTKLNGTETYRMKEKYISSL